MWLVIILVIGILIILIEYTLESLVVWLEKRGIVKTPSMEWFSNNTFQLQRLTHEELGLGDWDGCTGPRVIPTTEKGQLLGVLDGTDPKHPRLVKPTAVSGPSENEAKLDDPINQEGRVNNARISQDGSQVEASINHTETQTHNHVEKQTPNESQSSATSSSEIQAATQTPSSEQQAESPLLPRRESLESQRTTSPTGVNV